MANDSASYSLEEQTFLEDWLTRLCASGSIVIVEGESDAASLRLLDIPHVHALNRKPLYMLCEEIAAHKRDVVILTDLDAEGRRLYGLLYTELDRMGVHIDMVFREELFKHTQLRQIEGLRRYVRRRCGPML